MIGKVFYLDDLGLEINSSQQFATVLFDRREDGEVVDITVIRKGKVNQFSGDNRYNPSLRRHASCVYVREEMDNGKVIKICTVQHKGHTILEIRPVDNEELKYLFGVDSVNEIPVW